MPKRDSEPTQQTPTGAERKKLLHKKRQDKQGGLEIPVPRKSDVMDVLKKAAGTKPDP
jgi:hypothetical protein